MAKEKEKPTPRTGQGKLMIIDGNALIHRSFHALPPTMKTKAGEVTNAVYGFTSFLIKAIRELNPEYVVLTLDKKGPTFRHKKYKDYKATRVKAPDDLYVQIPIVKDVVKSFNIPIFEKTGFEADDLIGTISETVDSGVEKIIVTGDMDTLQLVDENTKVYTMSRGVTESIMYDAKQVKTRFGITPEQLIDYKALRGDPSDNIPGVAGIGEKTAVELLNEFFSLDKLYEYIENKKSKKQKIKTRILDLLTEHKADAYLSRELATIKRDVGIDFNLEATRFRDLDKNKVVAMLSKLEFRSLLPRLQALFNGHVMVTKEEKIQTVINKFERNKKEFNYVLINKEKQFNKFISDLKKQKYFTFDTETSSFDPLTADLLGISFSWKAGVAYYVQTTESRPSFAEATEGKKQKTEKKENTLFNYQTNRKSTIGNRKLFHPWLMKLKPIFENEKIEKYAHNLKFDWRVMRNNGIEVRGEFFDTMIASYLLNPGTRQHGLDVLTFSELGFEKISKDDLLGMGREKIAFSEVETGKLALYSAEDADFTMRLARKLKTRLKENNVQELFKEIEMPLVEVLAVMEENGICLDVGFLKKLGEKVDKEIISLEKNIQRQAGEKFNISSTQQLQVILFEKLAIPSQGIKKTKTGISTAADELEKIKDIHPVIRLIQDYRELTKLANTYIHTLPKLINKKTKRVHTSFNQAITATGRLSSSDPNLQNIPVRTELGREIRKAFIAGSGYKLLAFDYSQIELRVAAHMSGDKKMIKAFKNNADIHTITAAAIHGIKPEGVTKKMRREAKAINFGILYGQGPHGLSQTADIPYWRAKEFIDQYFVIYSDVKKYIDKSIKDARKKGYAETLFGRRRYLPELDSSVLQVKKAAERMAMNTPVQGTGADMIKMAMIDIANSHEFITNSRESAVRMLLQVHDELLFEVKSDKIKEVAPRIKKIMENVIKLRVPVVVDVSAGDNWGEMKEVE